MIRYSRYSSLQKSSIQPIPQTKQVFIQTKTKLQYKLNQPKTIIKPMQPTQNFSLLHVVNHLKYCLKKNDPKYYLTLEYKFAKPSQSIQGNHKFQQFLKDSHELIIVMNANRQKKRTDYVHLKSGVELKDFQNFQANVFMLNKIHKTESRICQKVDLNFMGQKISFDSQTLKWSYKSKRLLFRPNYETIKNGKLFRISLLSQAKGDKEPRKKVIQMLEQAVSKALQGEKTSGQDTICGSINKLQQKISETTQQKVVQPKQESSKQHKSSQPALRFKTQQTIHLSDCFSLVMSQVYQSIDTKLYKSIQQLVQTKKNSPNDIIGKLLLSEMVKEIFEDLKSDLHYEVELRFSPEFLKEMENEDEENVYHMMELAGEVFVALSMEPNEFSPDNIVQVLDVISKR